MHGFQNMKAYFAMAVNYTSKVFMKWVPGKSALWPALAGLGRSDVKFVKLFSNCQ
jgi:hypothetical protein